MTKIDLLRTTIKSLKGRPFSSEDVKDGNGNLRSRISTLVKNGEIAIVGRDTRNGQWANIYQEAQLRQTGLPTRVPFPVPLSPEESPWKGTWPELPVPSAYLAGKKTVHYGLSRVGPDAQQ